MAHPMITVHNSETDKVTIRPMNDVEFAHHEEILAAAAADKAVIEQAATQKAALLARLGITADEAKLLIG